MKKKTLGILITTALALALACGNISAVYATETQADTQSATDDTDQASQTNPTELPEITVSEWDAPVSETAITLLAANDGETTETTENSETTDRLTTADTGLLGTALTDLSETLYEGIAAFDAATPLTCTDNAVVMELPLGEDDTIRSLYDEVIGCFSNAMFAYYRDYQDEFLWCTGKVKLSGEDLTDTLRITMTYLASDHYTETTREDVDNMVEQITETTEYMTTYGKVAFFHDWLVDNNDYDTAITSVDEDDGSLAYYNSHTAVGCLVEGLGVCESYAKAFKILCLEQDIPCVLVSSESHMWNYVKMDNGKWYMVDCTWDDPSDGDGTILRDNFLIPNKATGGNHLEDGKYDYPATSDQDYTAEHEHYYRDSVVEPTCAATGYTLNTCEVCGDSYTDNETEKTDHVYQEIRGLTYTTRAAFRMLKCQNCDEQKEIIDTTVNTVAPASDDNDRQYYYKDGVVDTTFTGVAKNALNNTWWYVKDGVVDTTFNGIAKRPDKVSWWYCENGQVRFGFTGIAKRPDKVSWWYCENGRVRFDFTGIAKRPDNKSWWYCEGGRVKFDFTGIAKNPANNTWWYCQDSRVKFDYTGVAKNPANNTWWYCKNSKVDFTFNGIAQRKDNKSWWYCEGGRVRFNYTGVAERPDNHTWWYCTNSKVDFGFTGTVTYDEKTCEVTKGKVISMK